MSLKLEVISQKSSDIMIGDEQETVLLTGASGFIGKHLIEVLQDQFTIFALARRTEKEAGIPSHPNLHWNLVDITNDEELTRTVLETIRAQSRIDYVIHLAAFYDFGDQVYNETYEKTNVVATRRILELCKECGIKRFIFASSLVASDFPDPGDLVYEKSVLNAVFPYALTKQKGEDFTREFSEFFPCTVIRLAAVFSDWCEYEPLYYFLKTWLSNRWNARIFAGHQGMSIPYIHINCVTGIIRAIIQKTDDMKQFDVFLVSPDHPTSLLDLFKASTRLYLGEQREPIRLPIWFAKLGVLLRDILGRLKGNRPFERMWMTRYIDKEFPTDCSYTRHEIGWQPRDRHRIERRILYLIENMKSVPEEWHRKNLARVMRFRTQRPTLTLAQQMHRLRNELVDEIIAYLTSPENKSVFPYYQQLEKERLRYYVDRQYGNLFTSVRHGDRSVMIGFGHDLAKARHGEGVGVTELCKALQSSGNIITQRLYDDPRLKGIKQMVHDHITLAIQIAVDEIEDTYEQLSQSNGCIS
ncbi:MAG: NAD(P)-dependent oxidoreductase [Candidatus Krumholzibacteriota bacterium]